jgi:hypothetical protein
MSTVAPPKPDSLHTEFSVSPHGTFSCRGGASATLSALDSKIRQIALQAGAEEHTYPTVISGETLNRAEYFLSFPNYASRVEACGGSASYFLSPAVCYHCYEHLRRSRQGKPVIITCCGKCFRGDANDSSHLWEFTMREIVFLGSASFAHEQREVWMSKIQQWADELGLVAAMVAANDPFFGSETRGRKLLQQIKHLKYELRAQGPADRGMAIASFNLHEQFFARRFDIELENAGPAFSGCVAFGLERWLMALLARHSASEVLERLEGLQ